MKLLPLRNSSLVILLTLSVCFYSHAQEGTLVINQDSKITKLLELKKEINTNESDNERYRINIYSGSLEGAESARSKFKQAHTDWSTSLKYETPNYKIYAGSFRSRLEADRALAKIKKTFPNAFPLNPKKQ
ncbi:SPOR domain-containing protein [Bizionia gelidisalsuginis]|uniref:SPOR domain-containing protein n=2 Tax=Bizionia TaxID=283785 RepID=A0A8H2QKS9_9FLAO|nr:MULTISPECIES: SPOR domain-containing protein [Bizionia]TYB72176.1 SPOR domain-containing protein [Bizionia saleffrena]TYC10720.1 SPOR domain-containing protein [Bizionia gelidisalsuginis]